MTEDEVMESVHILVVLVAKLAIFGLLSYSVAEFQIIIARLQKCYCIYKSVTSLFPASKYRT